LSADAVAASDACDRSSDNQLMAVTRHTPPVQRQSSIHDVDLVVTATTTTTADRPPAAAGLAADHHLADPAAHSAGQATVSA